MNRSEAKKRIEKLKKEVDRHRYLYHVLDTPEISDAALDSLKNELFELEQQFPEFVTPDSPTQRVGGEVASGFRKVQHSSRMLSLNDAFGRDDLEAWIERLRRFNAEATAAASFFVEPKVDGLAMSLIYENGMLVTAATRGNGVEGEDVTHTVRTINTVPLRLHELKGKGAQKLPERVEVRGEVYIDKKDFEAINAERAKAGEVLYMNPRNTAAGAVRQLDPKIAASRNLKFMAYALPTDLGQKTHEQEHEIMHALGFSTDQRSKLCSSVDNVMALYDEYMKTRDDIPYQIDGMVIVVNDNALFERFGVVGKAPRAAIALKFPAEQVTTIVEDIGVQVGRTGTLTPVAHLKAVRVAGTIVKRATLHNIDEVRRLDVRVGDTVIIEKAGDIIPDVIESIKNLRPKTAKEFQMPKNCPACGTLVERREGEVAYICPNRHCPAQERERMYHFVGKDAFDIDGLGPAIIDSLVDAALVVSPADIFRLTVEDLLPLERFAEKSAENTINSIQARRHIALNRFIVALGIRHVGVQTAINLAQTFHSLKNLRGATQEELTQVPDIGPVASQSIYEYFQDAKHQEMVDDLLQYVTVEDVHAPTSEGPLTGATILFTGTLTTMTREEAQERARNAGATVSSSVTKDLTYLVAGEKAGSKLAKAEKQGTKVLTEEDFLVLVGHKSGAV